MQQDAPKSSMHALKTSLFKALQLDHVEICKTAPDAKKRAILNFSIYLKKNGGTGGREGGWVWLFSNYYLLCM